MRSPREGVIAGGLIHSVIIHAIQITDHAGMAMFEISNAKAKNVTNGPWQEAIERGWMSLS
jgi:hypothetical protein